MNGLQSFFMSVCMLSSEQKHLDYFENTLHIRMMYRHTYRVHLNDLKIMLFVYVYVKLQTLKCA